MYRAILTLIILMIMLAQPCQADSLHIKVSLPDYPVVLNGNTVNAAYSQYPPLVYKEVTYLPLTYNNSRNLGLETAWSDGTGLTVSRTGIFAEYTGSVWKTKNQKTYDAVISLYPVTVNGRRVDNSKETYPLLEFRNVTYFPMTWQYGVEAFGWEMTFDPLKGLAVFCGRTNLSLYPLKGITPYAYFTILDGNCYYGGMEGHTPCIFMAPVENPAAAVAAYRFDHWNDPEFSFPPMGVGKKDGKIYLTYHTGGATMGSDHVVLLGSDGTSQEIVSGYQEFAMDGENMVVANHFVPPAAGTLEYRRKDGTTDALGAADYYYGWMRHKDDQGTGYSNGGYIHVQDGWVTINASKDSGDTIENFMWRINLVTSEMQQLTHIPMKRFWIAGEDILFLGAEDSKLYKGSLQGADEVVLVDEAIRSYGRQGDDLWYLAERDNGLYLKTGNGPAKLMLPGIRASEFSVADGVAFAIDSENKRLYAVGKDDDPVMPLGDAHASQIHVRGDYAVAGLDWESDRGLAVFDGAGKMLFKTSDAAYYYEIVGDTLYYKMEESARVYRVHLKP